jgi:single-strand DNA-binding protein
MSNHVTLIGNLVEDPELRFTSSGIPVTNVRLAVNKRWKDKTDEWQEETSFFGGSFWRDQAENAAESLSKGDRVIVVGKLTRRSWETKEGEKRYVIEVEIDEIAPSLRWATASVTRTEKGGERPSTPHASGYGEDEAPF